MSMKNGLWLRVHFLCAVLQTAQQCEIYYRWMNVHQANVLFYVIYIFLLFQQVFFCIIYFCYVVRQMFQS